MKTYLKSEKGITITALIITIIVTITLAAVSLKAINPEEEDVLGQTKEVKNAFELKQIIEQIHNELDYNYYLNSGKSLTDSGNEDIVIELAKIIKETEISPNKFVIYYDKASTLNLIFYRENLVTNEEKGSLNNYDKVKGHFLFDANLDGVLSKDDLKLTEDEEKKQVIRKIINGEDSIISQINK